MSVVVCTRDRPRDLARCLESVAQLDPQPQEVIVVDQSSMPRLPSVDSPRIRHHPMAERGVARARNLGLALAKEEIIAFLDDDCVVGQSWAADIVSVFAREPDAGIVFGQVVPVSSDPDEFVPAYSIPHERRLKGRASAGAAHGISAAMYVRASTAVAVGEFDARLGPGAEFRASEDWDWTFRALAAGAIIVESPSVVVRHFGARRYSDGTAAQLLRWNAFSHGVVHAKLLRCGDLIGIVLVLTEVLSLVMLLRPLGALRGRPTNAARLAMYVRGLVAGSRPAVRRNERLFVEAAVEP